MKTILPSLSATAGVALVNKTSSEVVFISMDTAEAEIDYTSRLQLHRLEDGRMAADYKVILPWHVRLACFFSELSELDKLLAVLGDQSSLYTLMINGVLLDDAVCTSLEPNQTPEVMSLIPTVVEFKRVIVRQFGYKATEQSADGAQRKYGEKSLSGTSMTLEQMLEVLQNRI